LFGDCVRELQDGLQPRDQLMNQRQRKSILVVDDDINVTDSLRLFLSDEGFEVLTAPNVTKAGVVLREQQFDLVLTDLCLPDGTGIDVITQVKTETPETEVILMTGHGSLEITIEAIKRGAYYYLEKPCTPDSLLTLIKRALEVATLKRENERLKRTLSGGGEAFGMIGRNPKLHQILQTIRTTAPSDASVLIEGESGTGKELIAGAFHAQSQRAPVFHRLRAIDHDVQQRLFKEIGIDFGDERVGKLAGTPFARRAADARAGAGFGGRSGSCGRLTLGHGVPERNKKDAAR